VFHYSLHEDDEEIVLAEVKGLCRTLERTSRSLPAAGKELADDGSRRSFQLLPMAWMRPLKSSSAARRE
jgi:hypothetical protein